MNNETTTRLYQHSIATFAKIDPSKKYQSFTYYNVDKIEDASWYLEKNAIIRYGDDYYQYKGSKTHFYHRPIPGWIEIKVGRKITHTIAYI
jgi:hypothetical protein